MILFILIIALPHIIYDTYNNNSTQNNNIYKYSNNNNMYKSNTYYSTEIYWFCDQTNTNSHKPLLNEEEDERDEYNPQNTQCINNQLIFDIISCKKDKNNISF